MSILSVDLGHGETAAAYIEYGMKNGKPTQAVKRLNFEDKSFTVYSRIFITEEQMSALSQMSELSYDNLSGLGGFLIGNFAKQINKSGYTYNYFKIQPSKFDEPFEDALSIKYGITHGMVMACFAYEVIDQVLKSNPEIENFTRQNTTLLVGCPTSSQWTKSDFQKNYRELVSLATGMEQVVIIPESRAAMFSTVVGGEGSAISADLGALVFDFGSSTADCTYMLMGQLRKEFSWKLGASAIEENLYDSVVEEYNQSVSDNDRIDSVQNEKSKPEAERELRKAKEEFYSTGNPLEPICVIERTETKGKKLIPVDLDAAKLDEIVNERVISFADDNNEARVGSWSDLCEEFFQYAKEQIGSRSVDGKPCPIGTIAITGGASKMPFIKDLCERVFPDCEIHLERNPSYSVSNGLCWAFLSEQQIPRCAENAFETVVCDDKVTVERLASDICDSLIPVLSDIIEKKAITWGESAEDLSTEDLVNDIQSTINTAEVQDNIEKCVLEGVNHWDEGCKEVIHSAVLEQAKLLYGDHLPVSAATIDHQTICIDGLNLEKAIKDICNNLAKNTQDWVLSSVCLILGIAITTIGYVLANPILVAIGALLVHYSEKITSWIPVPDPLYKKKLPKNRRESVKENIHQQFDNCDSLKKIKAKHMEKVQKQLTEQGMTQAVINKQLKKSVEEAIQIWLLNKFAQEEVDCVD